MFVRCRETEHWASGLKTVSLRLFVESGNSLTVHHGVGHDYDLATAKEKARLCLPEEYHALVQS